MINLAKIFSSLQKGFLKNLLEGAGLALATTGASLVALHTAIAYFQSVSSGVPSALLGLLGLSGFDIFFTLILGAIVAKHKAKVTSVILKKK